MSMMPKPGSASRPLRPFVWGGAACLLLLPAIAMRLQAPGVQWTPGDLVAMGLMLAVACALYELAMRSRSSGSRAARAGFGLALATAFLTVWVNLAVGMFGSGDDPRNLMFVGVLLVAAVGAALARFRPRGMRLAMAAAAVAQLMAALAGAAGAAVGPGPGSAGQAMETILVAAFALPWLASAWLFRRADAGRHLVPH